jgi:hypothetical protein
MDQIAYFISKIRSKYDTDNKWTVTSSPQEYVLHGVSAEEVRAIIRSLETEECARGIVMRLEKDEASSESSQLDKTNQN